MDERTCSVDGCDAAFHARRLCHTHYTAWRRAAGPSATRKRPTPEQGWHRYARVGSPAECWEWAGLVSSGYGVLYCTLDGVTRQHGAHRVTYRLFVGALTPGMVIDHKCHNSRCVNPGHLREITRGQNNENRAGPQVNNTSGYRGVTFHKPSGKWMAQAHHLGRNYGGGYYATPEEAAEAAVRLRNRLFTCNIERNG